MATGRRSLNSGVRLPRFWRNSYPTEENGFDLSAAYSAIDAWRGCVAAPPGRKPPHETMPVGNSPRSVARTICETGGKACASAVTVQP